MAVSSQLSRVCHPRDRAADCIGVVFLGLALAWVVVAHTIGAVLPFDDGFIIYRYVDNLFAGSGLVYNAGERVFGVSAPLFLGWLVLLKSLLRSVATPDIAVRGNVVFLLAAAFGLFALLRRYLLSVGLAAALAGLFVLRPGVLATSLGGMEALALAGLVAWALWALVGRRFELAALLAGLSVLVRLEGVMLAAVVLAAWLSGGRRRPVAVLAGLVAPAVAWVTFGWSYYGTPVYHSLLAKLAPLYPLAPGNALLRMGRQAAVWSAVGLAHPPALAALPTLLLPGVGVWALRRLLATRMRWALPALALLLVLFYGVTNPLMFEWYYPVLEMLWVALVGVGLVWAGSRVARRWRWARPVSVGLVLTLVGVPALVAPVRDVLAGSPPFDAGVTDDPVRMRVLAYRHTAEWLNGIVAAGTRVAGPEIGSLGYYYRGPVIDACGLVSPEALRFLPVPDSERYNSNCGAISLGLVRECLPDVVVTIATFADKSLYDSDWFESEYIKVRNFPLPLTVWGAKNVHVFFHRGLLAIPAAGS